MVISFPGLFLVSLKIKEEKKSFYCSETFPKITFNNSLVKEPYASGRKLPESAKEL